MQRAPASVEVPYAIVVLLRVRRFVRAAVIRRLPKLAPRARWRRVLRRAAQMIVGVLALYLIVANVLLRTSLGRKMLNASPGAFLVEYESAYSLIPGRVHVEKLSIRGRSSSIEWRLIVDRGDFRIALTDLARKRFHTTWVRVEGAEFRLRLRLLPENAKPERLAALPPIPGFVDPPLLDVGPEPAPLTDAQYDLWSVQLDDVDVEHIREIWVHEERGVGDARIRGRWFFRPMRWLDVGPATVDVRSLDLTHAGDAVALGLHGSLGVTIHPFDVRVPSGPDTIDHLSGHADVKGFLSLSRGFGNALHLDDMRLVHGGGPLDVQLFVDHGVLAAGTHVRSESPATELVVGPMTVDAGVEVDLAVDASARAEKGRAGTMTLRATHVDVSAKSGAYAHAASLTTVVESVSDASLVLAHPYPFADADVVADLVDVEPGALEAWKAMIPAAREIHLPSGRARASAHLEGSLASRRGHGELRFAIDGLAVTREADRFASNTEGAVVVVDASLDEKRIDLAGSWVVLADTKASIRGVQVRAPRLAINATRATFGPNEPPKIELAFDLPRADVPDLRSVGALFAGASPFSIAFGRAHVGGKVKLELPARVVSGSAAIFADRVGARVKGVTIVFDLRARVAHARWAFGTKEVDLTDGDLVLTDVGASAMIDGKALPLFAIPSASAAAPRLSLSRTSARGRIVASVPRVDVTQMATLGRLIPTPEKMSISGRATAQLQADVDLGARTAAGTCTLAAHGVTIRAGSKTVTSDVGVALIAKSGATGESLDFSGSTLTIDNGEAPGGPHGWWGRVGLPDAAIWWRDGLHAHARIHARARDAEPASVLVSGETHLPEWVTRVFTMKDVDATAEVRSGQGSFELRSFFARGEGAAVRMEYATRAGQADGALLLELGELNIGIGLAESSGKVVLVGAHDWFDRRAAQLDARAAR